MAIVAGPLPPKRSYFATGTGGAGMGSGAGVALPNDVASDVRPVLGIGASSTMGVAMDAGAEVDGASASVVAAGENPPESGSGAGAFTMTGAAPFRRRNQITPTAAAAIRVTIATHFPMGELGVSARAART